MADVTAPIEDNYKRSLEGSVKETLKDSACHDHQHSPNRFGVVPTPERLNADPNYTGKGVTIAFLDSGFYPHADLSEPASRILAYHDLAQELPSLNPDDECGATSLLKLLDGNAIDRRAALDQAVRRFESGLLHQTRRKFGSRNLDFANVISEFNTILKYEFICRIVAIMDGHFGGGRYLLGIAALRARPSRRHHSESAICAPACRL